MAYFFEAIPAFRCNLFLQKRIYAAIRARAFSTKSTQSFSNAQSPRCYR